MGVRLTAVEGSCQYTNFKSKDEPCGVNRVGCVGVNSWFSVHIHVNMCVSMSVYINVSVSIYGYTYGYVALREPAWAADTTPAGGTPPTQVLASKDHFPAQAGAELLGEMAGSRPATEKVHQQAGRCLLTF